MSSWVDGIMESLQRRGYAIAGSPVGDGHLATRKVRNMGPLMPSTSFVFVHAFPATTTRADFETLHEAQREYAESRFRLPRIMRYHIPNTVTVGVISTPPAEDVVDYVRASKLDLPLIGGQKHSVYLFDESSRTMFSAGPEQTPTGIGPAAVPNNPTNRVYTLMREILAELGGTEAR